MSTRNITTKSSARPSTNRGRGGGRGRGRGGQGNHGQSNSIQRNLRNEYMGEIQPQNENRRGTFTFARNRGNQQPRGRESCTGDNTTGNSSEPDRIPRHVQNQFFTEELVTRFNHLIRPPSFLEAANLPQDNLSKNPPAHNMQLLDPRATDRHNNQSGLQRHMADFTHENKKLDNCKDSLSPLILKKVNLEDKKAILKSYGFRNGSDSQSSDSQSEKSDSPQKMNPLQNLQSSLIANRTSPRVRYNLENDNEPKQNVSPASNSKQNENENSKLKHAEQPSQNPLGLVGNAQIFNRPISSNPGSIENVNPLLGQSSNGNANCNARSETEKRAHNSKLKPADQPSQNPSGLVGNSQIFNRPDSSCPGNVENANPLLKRPSNGNANCNARRETENRANYSKWKPADQPSQNPLGLVGNTQIFNRPVSSNSGNIENVNSLLGRSSNGNANFNARRETENKAPQPNALSESFFATLDAFKGSSSSHTINPTNNGVIRSRNRQETNENRPHQNTTDNFNPFLKTERSHNQTERSKSWKDRYEQKINSNQLQKQTQRSKPWKERHEHTNHHPALFQPAPYDDRLTKKDFAGGNHFSVQRPARDVNERVPSRSEALQKMQQEYENQRADYEAKKREKEAKKREKYLARYSHVDQGHRLSEGLLDEAAGYAPGYNPFETEEEVRRRQQEQLRHDALMYQERQRQEQERQRRMEERKQKEKLEKNKHIDAGYRLGHGDHQGSERLLGGETEEEALQRQEEQLILEMLIQEQTKKQETDKELKAAETSSPAKSMNPFLSAKQNPKAPKQGSSINSIPKQLTQSLGLPRPAPEHPVTNKDLENNHLETDGQIGRSERNIQVEAPNPQTAPGHFGMKRQNNGLQMGQYGSKVLRNSVTQVPDYPRGAGGPQNVPTAAVGCVLRSPNGAVLVLRPSPEDLNRALARRLEVQDEVDKLGYSPNYDPTPEQAPLYSNNRFDRRLAFETDRRPQHPQTPSTGAIPKTTLSSPVKSVTLAAAVNALNAETATQDEPSIDLKAEMRAARLRLQQQYEEALKKKQEQNNESS